MEKLYYLLLLLLLPLLHGPVFAIAAGTEDGSQEWGYVEVRPKAHMFWWHYRSPYRVEDASTPWPIILWLQGGPGGSGVGIGNFKEVGPLDTNLQPRNSTWLHKADLLFFCSCMNNCEHAVEPSISDDAVNHTSASAVKDVKPNRGRPAVQNQRFSTTSATEGKRKRGRPTRASTKTRTDMKKGRVQARPRNRRAKIDENELEPSASSDDGFSDNVWYRGDLGVVFGDCGLKLSSSVAEMSFLLGFR